MEDRYLKALNFIENQQKNTIAGFGVESDDFEAMVKDMTGEKISGNAYAKVLEVYCRRYAKKDDRQMAVNYCIMQMNRLHKARLDKNIQGMYPKNSFKNQEEEFAQMFLKEHPDLYREMEETILKKLVLALSALTVVMMAFSVLVIHLPFFFCLILQAGIAAVLYFAGKQYLCPMLIEDRMSRMIRFLDPIHQNFEKRMGIAAPKPFAF